jgi:hypothetical protein
MKLNELIRIVSAAYPDGLLAVEYWDFKRECPRRNLEGGDTLALFIALELKDTYDADASGKQQIETALRTIERAQVDLEQVIKALYNELTNHKR